jgi:hypothetical protein
MWKYFLAWIPMVAIAIVNGSIRQAWYGNHTSELAAHQISTLSGVLLFGLYIWAVMRRWRPASSRHAWTVGLLWLGLTITFEFLFGHYVAGHTWERLLADYNLLAGRVWLVALVWVTIAPVVFYRLQR